MRGQHSGYFSHELGHNLLSKHAHFIPRGPLGARYPPSCNLVVPPWSHSAVPVAPTCSARPGMLPRAPPHAQVEQHNTPQKNSLPYTIVPCQYYQAMTHKARLTPAMRLTRGGIAAATWHANTARRAVVVCVTFHKRD